MRASYSAFAFVLVAAACTDPRPTESGDYSPSHAKGTTTSGPVVSSTSPSSSVRGATLDVRVLGSGFDVGSTARWAIKGVPAAKVVTNRTTFVSSKELVANITIASDADLALYDVIVTAASGKPGIGTEKFEVTIEIVNLGNLGGTESGAAAINEAGQVAGYSSTSSGGRAFLWENGVMRNLGVPPGFTSSRAEGINNLGHVVGYAMVQTGGAWNARAFLWTPENGMQLLPGASYSTARAINDNGVISGFAKKPDGTYAGAVWINGAMQFLPDGTSEAWDVNSLGQVVVPCKPTVTVGNMNWSSTCIWSAETGLQYAAAMRGSAGEPLGINDSGDITGWGPQAGTDSAHAYVTRGGVVQDLGAAGGLNSAGIKISSNGFIVGRVNDRAVLWYPTGSMITLPGFVGSAGKEALDVNSRGEVVGSITVSGRRSSTKYAVKWVIN